MKPRQLKTNAVKSAKGRDTYDQWLSKHRGGSEQELPEANPDVLLENDGLWFISSEQKETCEAVRELIIRSPQFLTPVQNTIFRHVMNGKNILEISRLISRHVSSVQEAWGSASRKLIREFKKIQEVREKREGR